jgi:hypothetical protein
VRNGAAVPTQEGGSMLRTRRLKAITDPARPWLLYCDRCGYAHPHGLSEGAALELDQTPCFNCEVDESELRLAFAVASGTLDRN